MILEETSMCVVVEILRCYHIVTIMAFAPASSPTSMNGPLSVSPPKRKRPSPSQHSKSELRPWHSISRGTDPPTASPNPTFAVKNQAKQSSPTSRPESHRGAPTTRPAALNAKARTTASPKRPLQVTSGNRQRKDLAEEQSIAKRSNFRRSALLQSSPQSSKAPQPKNGQRENLRTDYFGRQQIRPQAPTQNKISISRSIQVTNPSQVKKLWTQVMSHNARGATEASRGRLRGTRGGSQRSLGSGSGSEVTGISSRTICAKTSDPDFRDTVLHPGGITRQTYHQVLRSRTLAPNSPVKI